MQGMLRDWPLLVVMIGAPWAKSGGSAGNKSRKKYVFKGHSLFGIEDKIA